MTTLMQAHRQWSSRAPDERFTSLLELQSFKRRVREQSHSTVISSRKLAIDAQVVVHAGERCLNWGRFRFAFDGISARVKRSIFLHGQNHPAWRMPRGLRRRIRRKKR